MPTQWYTVHLDSPPQGVKGETAANMVGGGLSLNATLVEADSEADAIAAALVGTVTVDLSAANLPTTTYSATDISASGGSSAFHVIHDTNSTSGSWQVQLEDLAAYPTVSDWDYNDFYWDVSVANAAPPDGNSGGSGGSGDPGASGGYSDPGASGGYYDPGASGGSSGGTTPVYTGVPDSATTSLNTPVAIPVLANDSNSDGSPLTLAYANGAMNGTLTVTPDGQSVVYTPNADFTGTDSFYYMTADSPNMTMVDVTVTDPGASGGSSSAAPTVNIVSTNSPTAGVDTEATFAISLSQALSQPLTVTYTPQDGTAVAGTDYESTTGTVTFYPGETTKAVTVPVLIGACPDESDRQFQVLLQIPPVPPGNGNPANPPVAVPAPAAPSISRLSRKRRSVSST